MNEIRWQRRGMIHIPVIEEEPERVLCRVCGAVSPVGLCRACRDSARVRVHGSHAGFAQHKRRNELPCQSCSDAEKAYQRSRYRRGSLSPVDLAWAEKQEETWQRLVYERTNRASIPNII